MTSSDNLRGAVFMSASMTAFAINDTFIKLLGDHLPFFQILFLRSIGTVVFLTLLAWGTGHLFHRYSRPDASLVAIRAVGEVGAAVCFITALFHLPLANVTAIIQALPLTVTLAAALVFGERVGWRRLLAIAVGVVGVMLIVRPGADGFDIYAVYALCAVGFVTVRDLAARRLSKDTPSVSVALLTALAVLGFASVGALVTEWQPMAARDWLWMSGAVVAIMGGYLFSVMAMRSGEIGFVTQFRYSAMLVALILGYAVFGDWPDAITLAGAGLVVATGLFTLWRERTSRHSAPLPLRTR